jgi:hypothetical protein
MSKYDQIYLDSAYLANLDDQREVYDLEGWVDIPVKTFSAARSVPWVEGDVTEEDTRVAAGIRDRVWRSRGAKEP